MGTLQGYRVYKETPFETGHGFALGYGPGMPDRFAVWQYTETGSGCDCYSAVCYRNAVQAWRAYKRRVSDYGCIYKVRERTGVGKPIRYYRYYSTQRPVDIGTYPKPPGNEPLVVVNYDVDARRPVAGGLLSAWGELVYRHPLTERQADDYELVPAPSMPEAGAV